MSVAVHHHSRQRMIAREKGRRDGYSVNMAKRVKSLIFWCCNVVSVAFGVAVPAVLLLGPAENVQRRQRSLFPVMLVEVLCPEMMMAKDVLSLVTAVYR